MKKKISLILLFSILIIIIVMFISQVIINKEITGELIGKTILSLAICGKSIATVISGRNNKIKNTTLYENTYANIIRTAFHNNHELKKELMDAIHLYNQDKYEKAIKKLNHMLPSCRSIDEHVAVLMFTALSFSEQGLLNNAIKTYLELLDFDHTMSTAWSNLGLLYKESGANEKAIDAFQKAIKYDDTNAYGYNNLVAAYLAEAKNDEAIENALKSIERKSNMYEAMNILAIAYLIKGDTENSEKYYKLSVLNGGDGKALKNLLIAISNGDT